MSGKGKGRVEIDPENMRQETGRKEITRLCPDEKLFPGKHISPNKSYHGISQ